MVVKIVLELADDIGTSDIHLFFNSIVDENKHLIKAADLVVGKFVYPAEVDYR